MLDTTPDAAGPRALVTALTEARSEERWIRRRLALAPSESERARLRLELELQVARIARLTERHAALPAWERR
jgi:hypothetical protein